MLPGCALSKFLPMTVYAAVSEEAAKTVIVPLIAEGLEDPEAALPHELHIAATAIAARARQRTASQASGSSTITLVALTTATARTPGARPSSSAASREIKDTSRYGPACSSTCAMTRSLTTRVTMPWKWLRADRPTVVSGLTSAGVLAMKRASCLPST